MTTETVYCTLPRVAPKKKKGSRGRGRGMIYFMCPSHNLDTSPETCSPIDERVHVPHPISPGS